MGAHWIDIIGACGPRAFPRVVLDDEDDYYYDYDDYDYDYDDAGAAGRDACVELFILPFVESNIFNICFSFISSLVRDERRRDETRERVV